MRLLFGATGLALILATAVGAWAQTPVTIVDQSGAISTSNPFPVTSSTGSPVATSDVSGVYLRTATGIVGPPPAPGLPVDLQPTGAALTNCSGIIAVTGTPQTASAANANRRAFQIQNTSTHAMAWSDMITNPAVGNAASSWQLAATTGSYTAPAHMVPTTAITVVGTAGDAFTCQTR